jgi:NAD(P)H dehydrogenase (quinone)
MKVLLVFAHPEPRSLNGALRHVAIQELEAQGHEVLTSDLYAINWKSEVDQADFPLLAPDERFIPAAASKKAFEANALTEDVKAEVEKLLWADALILQFPLWWFTMPAILKGWVDRVFAYGFAYGVGEHSDKRWGDRYGEGTLAGKRAMLRPPAAGRSITPPAGSTGRSTTCCSRSIMGSSIIPATTCFRHSWSTG